LRVKGTYSSGNESEITQDVRWETSDGTLATVDEKGSLLAQKEGKVAVIARSGNLASEPLNLSIKPALTKLASKAGNVTKTTKAADASEFIRAARSFRDRGSYAEAFNELAKASKVDPSNKEIQVEVAITQRACNAEKNLGRADLRC
jgi:Bacterial Ig-like domain (group 2)